MASHHRVYAFFDGAHIRDGLAKMGVDWRDVDLSTVARAAIKWVGDSWQGLPLRMTRVWIYDAIPDEGSKDDGEVEYWLTRNDRQADTHVRRGHLAGDPRKQSLRRQKAVDVQLAVDALEFSSQGVFDAALFVTGDADFVPVAESVRNKGYLVAVCSFRDKLAEVWKEVADRVGFLPDDPKAWDAWKLPSPGE